MLGLSKLRHFVVPLKNHLPCVQECAAGKTIFPDIFSSFLKPRRTFSVHAPQTRVFERGDSSSSRDELSISRETIKLVNEQVRSGNEGRLFAVVQICGKQFKITTEDIIIIEGYWPPQIGSVIKLEKVLLVGGLDFTLLGRPLLPQDVVSIKATVIEKDLSHTKTIFYKKKRKQYQRINFFRSQFTMLRINEILLKGNINEHKSTSQYERI